MGFSLISTAEIVYHCIMGCFNGKSEEIGSIGETSNDSNKFLCNNQNNTRHSIYVRTVISFNPNWYELRKQEKCSSLAPPRSKFCKAQLYWQGVKLA